MHIVFSAATPEDFERLLALRLSVMREHLERLGRFDSDRARARFSAGFAPAFTRLVHLDGAFAGCVTLRPGGEGIELEHFYLRPEFHGQGTGSRILACLLEETDQAGQRVHLGVLKQSPARRFYERHGFVFTHAGEFDDYFIRMPRQGTPSLAR